MNAKEANINPISQYLAYKNIFPIKKFNGYLMYISPLRNESTPSFKLNLSNNIWCDFGDNNIGGTLIDLVLKLNPQFKVSDAILEIKSTFENANSESVDFIFQEPKEFEKTDSINYEILKVQGLKHPALISYAISRGISKAIAVRYLKEIYYKSSSGKKYFACAIQNSAGGYNLRSKYHKNILGSNSYTILKSTENNQSQLQIVEGFFDALSLIAAYGGKCIFDILILNSCSNVNKITKVISKYSIVQLALDNDKAGSETTTAIFKLAIPGQKIIDCSGSFKPYLDINEYLINNLNKF